MTKKQIKPPENTITLVGSINHEPLDKHPVYIENWNRIVKELSSRDSFDESHKSQISILCDLYVEYHTLANFLRIHGSTYESEGRNGFQLKPRPELSQKNKVIDQIHSYTKLLEITPKKPGATAVKPKDDQGAWE